MEKSSETRLKRIETMLEVLYRSGIQKPYQKINFNSGHEISYMDRLGSFAVHGSLKRPNIASRTSVFDESYSTRTSKEDLYSKSNQKLIINEKSTGRYAR